MTTLARIFQLSEDIKKNASGELKTISLSIGYEWMKDLMKWSICTFVLLQIAGLIIERNQINLPKTYFYCSISEFPFPSFLNMGYKLMISIYYEVYRANSTMWTKVFFIFIYFKYFLSVFNINSTLLQSCCYKTYILQMYKHRALLHWFSVAVVVRTFKIYSKRTKRKTKNYFIEIYCYEPEFYDA